MKAVRIRRVGGPDIIVIDELPIPANPWTWRGPGARGCNRRQAGQP